MIVKVNTRWGGDKVCVGTDEVHGEEGCWRRRRGREKDETEEGARLREGGKG